MGSDASRAGVHNSEKHSITNDSRKMTPRRWTKAIVAYSAPRAMSAAIMIFLRSNRSTNAPANGPNRIAGSILAVMTPPIARPLVLMPDKLWTSDVTATNPTQSPRDDTVIAASRRENPWFVSRSLRVADLVPRSAATSSAMLATSR